MNLDILAVIVLIICFVLLLASTTHNKHYLSKSEDGTRHWTSISEEWK